MWAAGGSQVHPSLRIDFGWRELPRLKVILSPSMTDTESNKMPGLLASIWRTTLKESAAPEPPAGSPKASLLPTAHSDKPPAHTSPSQSIFPGSRLRAMGPPLPKFHLLLTYAVDGLFQQHVISLDRDWEWAVLLLFCRDFFYEYRVFSRSGRSLTLPRWCSPKCLP